MWFGKYDFAPEGEICRSMCFPACSVGVMSARPASDGFPSAPVRESSQQDAKTTGWQSTARQQKATYPDSILLKSVNEDEFIGQQQCLNELLPMGR